VPLLPKEVDLAPAELFELPPELEWRVAHVRSRQEKMLARLLLHREVPFYLPQTAKRSVGGVRARTSYLPLFPGYVFFRGDAAALDVVRRSDLAVNVLDVADQQLLHDELRQLRQLQVCGASLIPYDDLLPGDPVRVTEGSFAGYTGVIVRSTRGDRLLVAVTLLRKNVAVEFGRTILKRALGFSA